MLAPGTLYFCSDRNGPIGLWHEPGSEFMVGISGGQLVLVLSVPSVPHGTYIFYVLAMVAGRLGYVAVSQLEATS